MNRIVVFAGTTEGRKIVRWMKKKEARLFVCTATEYGKELLEDEKLAEGKESQLIEVYSRRMNKEEMKEFLQNKSPDWVIDATHPYAVEVTKNIRQACEEVRCPYLRVLREQSEDVLEVGNDLGNSASAPKGAVRYVVSIQEAAEYLSTTKGKILIATGSKELGAYTVIPGYRERCYARVLSTAEAVEKAFQLGFAGAHLIAMQGPFSEEMNIALLRQTGAEYFVTKESGKTGGYPEKARACKKAGAQLVVIGRPPEMEGMYWEEACRFVSEELKLPDLCKEVKSRMTLVGIGPGARAYLTEAALEALNRADIIFGAGRMLALLKEAGIEGKRTVEAYTPEAIREVLQKAVPEAAKKMEQEAITEAAVLLSGDVSFYSGAKRVREAFEAEGNWEVEMLPGISSIVYLAAKLGVSLDETAVGSMHGRSCNVAAKLKTYGKLFLLTEGNESIVDICKELCYFGWGDARVAVGSSLSYKEERIAWGTVENPPVRGGEKLSVLYLELTETCRKPLCVSQGIEDEDFVRGKVPMTKQEIRSVSLSKLALTDDAIVYDVGAGTGSVAVEAALAAENGIVYAIERNPEGISLIEENRRKFAVSNLKAIEGTAPEALFELPPPTHVFLGGSGGKFEDIVETVWTKNPFARIVVNAITVETLAEVSEYVKRHPKIQSDFVQIQSSRGRKAGNYHLMTGMNPVFIMTLWQE